MVKVLIVDDEEMVRMVIANTLRKVGITVEEAENGRAAVLRFQENPADVVITDIIMPEQEGIETIIELKRISPTVKIIAISGGGRVGTTDYLEIARDFGAIRTFTKPFDRMKMLEAVYECLTEQ